MIKYALALQTPTIVLNVVAKDGGGNVDKFRVEYKRYDLDKSKQKLKEFDALYEDFNNFNRNATASTEYEIESNKDKLQIILDELNIKVKEFVKNEVIGFRDIKCRDAFGKVVETIKDTTTEGDNFEQWGEAANCTNAWFEHFWSSNPYKEAIHTGMLSAIRNTSN